MAELTARDVGHELLRRNYKIFSGVPCSLLGGLIEYLESRSTYIRASDEGNAISVCAGAYLGWTKAAVLLQNSGLTNALSPLTSLLLPYGIPVLGFMTLRGEPGTGDASQHKVMGDITLTLLNLCGVSWDFLASTSEEFNMQLSRAEKEIAVGKPYFFIVRKERGLRSLTPDARAADEPKPAAVDAVAKASVLSAVSPCPSAYKLRRATVLESVRGAFASGAALLSTTGYTSRELYTLGDEDNQFYMTGSMGCLPSLALGLALAQPKLKVVILDGDGALLMRLGALAMIGYYRPANLVHLVLNNGCYESTGRQPSLAQTIDLRLLAVGAGYKAVHRVADTAGLRNVLRLAKINQRTAFVDVKIRPGSLVDIPRPTHTPEQLTVRFRDFVMKKTAFTELARVPRRDLQPAEGGYDL